MLYKYAFIKSLQIRQYNIIHNLKFIISIIYVCISKMVNNFGSNVKYFAFTSKNKSKCLLSFDFVAGISRYLDHETLQYSCYCIPQDTDPLILDSYRD